MIEIVGLVAGLIAIITGTIAIMKEWKKRKQELYEKAYQYAFKRLNNNYFVRNERILDYPDEVRNNTIQIWNNTKQYIKMISLTALPGLPWSPSEKLIKKKVREGIKVKVLLLHPHSMDFIAKMEAICTDNPEFIDLTEETIKTEFITQLQESVPKLISTIGEENVRFYRGSFFWKGTIVDGKYAQYVFYDIPRKNVPFRYTEDTKLIEYFEKVYFDEFWERAESFQSIKKTILMSISVDEQTFYKVVAKYRMEV